jgi:hypothetical protein
MNLQRLQIISVLVAAVTCSVPAASGRDMDLREARILIPEPASRVQTAAARLLQEEVQRRTGLSWAISSEHDSRRPGIALATAGTDEIAGRKVPLLSEPKPEGYRICVEPGAEPVVWIVGADARGVLFGAGRLLRLLDWGPGRAHLEEATDITTAPAYPIRGHQLGYRARANSYDAWTAATYEQYIRDLILFGTNCIENIPFEDDQPSPHMPIPRDRMNVLLSQICARYDLDYWVWTPVTFDLRDPARRTAELEQHTSLYQACPRLNAVFVPGGDPGANPPEVLLPFLKAIATRLRARHPAARVWLSLQWFSPVQIDEVYAYLAENQPDWLGGLVAGPSSPPIPETRKRLSARYRLRHYPDITHTVRCQYPVPWWDPAFSLTLGRECPNPRPVGQAQLHNSLAGYTDGFLTYSDGIHDDVNKIIWSARGWQPDLDPIRILRDYARVFFQPDVAESVVDGILSLEENWEGPLSRNGGVEETLLRWQRLEARAPRLHDNWRAQLCLLRAHYDAYVRRRLQYETQFEDQANAALAHARESGADQAMYEAQEVLRRATTHPTAPELRERIVALCEDLFRSIGLQTSVKTYQASGAERGAVLDYVDYPLNNRWWLEDEFEKVRALPAEEAKLKRLEEIRTWENPGSGSCYDNVGNVAKSPHVVGRGSSASPEPTHWWWDEGFSRKRLSWQVSMDWPVVLYRDLDPQAEYVIRITGYGEALTRVNGNRVTPTLYGKGIGEIKEFPVPREAVQTGELTVTWDLPQEAHLNWRQQSRISEIWLLKK